MFCHVSSGILDTRAHYLLFIPWWRHLWSSDSEICVTPGVFRLKDLAAFEIQNYRFEGVFVNTSISIPASLHRLIINRVNRSD
jgi:hypothetical protein